MPAHSPFRRLRSWRFGCVFALLWPVASTESFTHLLRSASPHSSSPVAIVAIVTRVMISVGTGCEDPDPTRLARCLSSGIRCDIDSETSTLSSFPIIPLLPSHRQIFMSPLIRPSLIPSNTQPSRQVWPDHRHIVYKARHRLEELSKEYKHAVALHQKAYQGPSQQDQRDSTKEGRRTAPLLASGEEGKRSLWPKQEGYADEEENVAHCEEGAVEEQDEAEEEEETA